MADHPFAQPIRLSDGQRVVVLKTVAEVGSFLLRLEYPRRKRPRSYAVAVQACVRAIGGSLEPETCRQAFMLALADLAPARKADSRKVDYGT